MHFILPKVGTLWNSISSTICDKPDLITVDLLDVLRRARDSGWCKL
jgi:hypothetical protein